jgi:hypothetical protein
LSHKTGGQEMPDNETIKCGKCGADSGIEKSGSEGTDAARVQHIGWMIKLPILVGIAEWFMTCSEPCMRSLLDAAYAEHGITEKDRSDANKVVAECKEHIPQMAKETAEVMGRMQKVLRGGKRG